MTPIELRRRLRDNGEGRRITFDEVQLAYQVAGIKSYRGAFVMWDAKTNRVTCGCPQTALFIVAFAPSLDVSDDCSLSLSHQVNAWAEYRYGSFYARAFQKYFDEPWCDDDTPINRRAIQGYVDGFAIRMALDKAENLWPFGPLKVAT